MNKVECKQEPLLIDDEPELVPCTESSILEEMISSIESIQHSIALSKDALN